MSARTRPLLIVDSEPAFLARLRDEAAISNVPALICQSREEAQIRLADKRGQYAGIVVNPRVGEPYGLSIVRCAQLHHIGTPLYFLCDPKHEIPFSARELKRLAVQKVIRKPIGYRELVALVAPAVQAFDADGALRAKSWKDTVGQEVTRQDDEFSPILAEHFVAGRTSFFDLYIRLKSGRYIKLLSAGDSFDVERIESYLRKGVSHFHIRKDAQSAYVSYCDQITSALLKSAKVAVEVKAAQTLNLGQETTTFLRDSGISEANLGYASSFVAKTQLLASQIGLQQHDVTSTFLKDLAAVDHGVSVSMVAALMTKAFKVESSRLQDMIGLAALLHDIGLQQLLPELGGNEDPELMSHQQRALYLQHPERGAEILRGVKRIDAAVVQAVRQHHERKDGRGFPMDADPGMITRVAEMVGLADEFVVLIQKSMRDRSIRPVDQVFHVVGRSFSSAVLEAFRAGLTRMRGRASAGFAAPSGLAVSRARL